MSLNGELIAQFIGIILHMSCEYDEVDLPDRTTFHLAPPLSSSSLAKQHVHSTGTELLQPTLPQSLFQ